MHGAWCNSRTIPITCKYCGKKIFYFSCDCGCKVFWEDLGGDWPKHECTGFNNPYNKIKTSSAINKTAVKVPWVLIEADEIDENYKEKIRNNKTFFYSSNIPILSIGAEKNKVITVTGIIKELINNVDLFKLFKIDKNSTIGSNLLKEFGNKSYHQITIHTINIESKKDSYTTLIADEMMRIKDVHKNDNIIIKLLGLKILDTNKWNCVSIEKLDDILYVPATMDKNELLIWFLTVEAEEWKSMAQFAGSREILKPKERRMLYDMGTYSENSWEPSFDQLKYAKKLYDEMKSHYAKLK